MKKTNILIFLFTLVSFISIFITYKEMIKKENFSVFLTEEEINNISYFDYFNR